jgi:hypothetical protein
MSDISEAEAFMESRLGGHWELRLAEAAAMPGPDATNEEVDAAQQRALDLICETSEDWTLELRGRAAEAWAALRMQ